MVDPAASNGGAGMAAGGADGEARRALLLAARHGLRAAGRVEPNPLVGCVIVRPRAADREGGGEALHDRVVAIGHHRVFGGAHAEADALASALARGVSVRGCTMYVTLEPCNSQGRNPACVDAVIEAGIARVVYAAADDSAGKGGGHARLLAAGVACEQTTVCAEAMALSAAWRVRQREGRPYVVVKWAQTIDGKLATLGGDSRWISGEKSRARVHRVRGCVGAIVTGAGTARVDDPLLTARGVSVRSHALRVVLGMDEAELRARGLKLADGLEVEGRAGDEGAGVPETIGVNVRRGEPLLPVLKMLGARGVHSVLVEAGPRLAGAFIEQGLADELHVYTGAMLLGGPGLSIGGAARERMSDASGWSLLSVRRSGPDVLSVWVRSR